MSQSVTQSGSHGDVIGDESESGVEQLKLDRVVREKDHLCGTILMMQKKI
jgi:hypothetical protein